MPRSLIAALAACVVVVASISFIAFGQHKSPAAGGTEAAGAHADMKAALYPAAEMKWADGPASLPKGCKIALLEGDPAKEGPFTFRLKMPDGYRIPPHMHPKVERITVISGQFHLGMGEKFDAAGMQVMAAGTYGYWPAGMKHFAMTTGETVLQLHGTGPWSIQYLNPADDPRNAK